MKWFYWRIWMISLKNFGWYWSYIQYWQKALWLITYNLRHYIEHNGCYYSRLKFSLEISVHKIKMLKIAWIQKKKQKKRKQNIYIYIKITSGDGVIMCKIGQFVTPIRMFPNSTFMWRSGSLYINKIISIFYI